MSESQFNQNLNKIGIKTSNNSYPGNVRTRFGIKNIHNNSNKRNTSNNGNNSSNNFFSSSYVFSNHIGWVIIYLFAFGISDLIVKKYIQTDTIYILYYLLLGCIGFYLVF